MRFSGLRNITLLVVLMLPFEVYASPSITSTSGTLTHGQTITVNGTGFGFKSTAAPLIWDDCSGTTITNKWSGGWPNANTGGNANYNLAYRTPVNAVALPHSHVTKYMAGAHMDGSDYNSGYNVMVYKNFASISKPTTIYMSTYWQVDPRWANGSGDNNFKTFDYSQGTSPMSTKNWYTAYNFNGGGQTQLNNPAWLANDDGNGVSNSSLSPSGIYGSNGANVLGHWVKTEIELKITDQTSGYLKVWDNGVQVFDYSGPTDRYTGDAARSLAFGGYARAQGSSTQWRYFSDLYFDTTPQRVLICTGSTWTNRGVCEVQIPQTWTDNGTTAQITATVNQASFTDNSTKWLFVVDSNGNASNGQQITFGSSGGGSTDTTVPTASITSPTSGTTVNGTTTATVSASDNVGVTKVEFYVDGSLYGTNTSSPYTFAWNTATASNGSHTLSAKSYDAANNVGTSASISVTVSNATVDTTAPTGSISSPTGGTTVSGNFTVTASASDNVGVSKVEFYLDSATTPAATITSSPYTFNWNTSSVANGTHTIKAKAYDAANNVGQFATVSITVNNTSTPPASAVARNECANPPPGTVFCEDFEGANPKSHFDDYDGNPDTENLVVTDSGPSGDSSNKEIRLRVPAGQSGVSDLIKVLPATYDKLYARWYFKYEPGFNFAAPNHGGGLWAGNRNYVGQSGYRPNGDDFAGFNIQYQENTTNPYAYSYYRGMYQDCTDPNGSCWGDSVPCVFDNGANFCTKPQDRPTVTLPNLVAGQWYCVEEMVDMGTPTTTAQSANGRLTLWLDSNQLVDNQNLWLRTTANLKIQNLWLSLYHHDGTHSTVGELIDNVVVSTQRVGCGSANIPSSPLNLRTPSVTP
jgi:hypothetical protein